ncbi:hypothetical protein [Tenacibaculum sp. SG-28]|uniref:hypothetical protein n=1 Tax=Tenacibaculum sp. SG-28 TaxID=754426 RepID=UPI000CF45FAF|nr:hypothetical protein [Tenacibaculum sp. SG-28]PQJ22804.1 hypothetical protein BSU00_00330 [Tenacibaculum sp. SG-28]
MKFSKHYIIIVLVSHLSYIYSQETIPIPDIGFEEALIDLNLDSNGLNGNILRSDAETIINLNINNPENNKNLPNVFSAIKSLSGIEHFSNLKRLDCSNNKIQNLNLSKNKNLTFLNCSYNQLKELNIRDNTLLTTVSCDNNQLETLILGKHTALTDLFCNTNRLQELDISNCASLENLDASDNALRFITVNKFAYQENKDIWYKDANTSYLSDKDMENSIKNNAVKTSEQKKKSSTVKNYEENFQKKVVAEYEKNILNKKHLQTEQSKLVKKYNLSNEELNIWIQKFSTLPSLE